MSTPSFEITAYTPLETLLLFHNLSTHGTHPTSFSLISNILVRNPLVKNGETFDRGRLAPDALREFYLLQLKEAESELGNSDGQVNGDGGRSSSPAATRKKKAKTLPAALSNPDKTPVVKILTSRLYEQYRSIIFRQIRDDERRYSQLGRDIEEITAGLWDERLQNEKTVRARSRSSSVVPRRPRDERISPSPGLEGHATVPDVEENDLEDDDKSLLPNVSIEVSPRAVPTPQAQTPQHAISQDSTALEKSPSQPLILLRRTTSPIKLEQPSPVAEIHSPVSISQQSPPSPPSTVPTRDQGSEGLRDTYKATHPQTKREGIKAGLGQTVFEIPSNQMTIPWQVPNVQALPVASPRQTLAAPIPSPQVPPKMEAVPPPPPPSTSSPVAPPLSRPLGVKIEAPVPPPTRTPFPPITPRPLQPAYPPSQTRPPTISVPTQQQLVGHQGLSGLLQLADVADTRWQQQHTPSYAPQGTPIHPHMTYPPPGQQSQFSSGPTTPHVQGTPQAHRTPTPATPGGGNFGILFPSPAPATPSAPVQQYPAQYSGLNQARPISIPQPSFQHYSPQVPAQHNFEQVSPIPSPPVQRIAPRPPLPPSTVPAAPVPQPQNSSPNRVRPPPINTMTVSPRTPPQPQTTAQKGEPGSPIPPRPDEISPISTPSRSPAPPESPKLPSNDIKLPSSEVVRGTKRPFQEDEKDPEEKEMVDESKKDEKSGKVERGREEKPAAKRQKATKYDKTPGKKEAIKGRLSVEKEIEKPMSTQESKVKDEETEAMNIDSPTRASVLVEVVEEPVRKPKGRGRPPKKPKAKPEERPEPQSKPQLKDKRTKRKRADTNAPTPRVVNDGGNESELGVVSVSPTPQRRRYTPKLEPQTSNVTINVPSPSPLTVAIGQQPLVVATKKFLQLSAPLLGDISSHKFANLFSNAVNERMAPGYRNLVFRPQDLKSIKAAVKSGTAAITNASTGTPAMTPTTEPFAAATPPASSSTFATLPATTLNTPPKGIVNSVQLEKELFRMFANAIMYNKSTTEIAKETVMMARNVEGMVDNFRTAEEAGMKKALGAAATGGGFGSARKSGARERDNTVETATREEEQSVGGDKDDGDGEDSVMGDTDGASERGKGKGGIGKRKRLKR